MDKKQLIKICKEKSVVKLNLKNGHFFTGKIKEIGETSILFLDKFNLEIPIDIDSISYSIPTGKTMEEVQNDS